MRLIHLLLIFFFLLSNCSKPKTVLICGDHICINKSEAEQYFEENLSIEVKIIDKKKRDQFDLVELNLNNDQEGNKKIGLSQKKSLNKEIKILSNKEIDIIKKSIKDKKEKKKISKKIEKTNKKTILKDRQSIKDKKIIKKNVYKNKNDVVDICTIIEKCSIDEISEYLLEQSKKKDFPDITTRQ